MSQFFAAALFYRAVRAFVQDAKPWQPGVIAHHVMPDERMDITKISERVYGNRHEFLAVMAAANMSDMSKPMPDHVSLLLMPPVQALEDMKRGAGFESNPVFRDNGAPTWII